MVTKFIRYLRNELNRAELTAGAYEMDINQFCEWLSPGNPKEVDFYTVTSSDVRAWLASLSRKGESPRTLRRKIISLRVFYKWMMKTGQIKVSPLQNVPLPKLPKPLPDLIKPEEIEDALDNINDIEPEDYSKTLLQSLIVELLYTLGIRRAELTGLNDQDINYDKGEIKVTGKRSKQRVVPAPRRLLNKIKGWQMHRDEKLRKPENETPLFVWKGKRLPDHVVYRMVKEALAGSSARKKSPHALRHSFASAMLNGGAEIDSVKEFLGHSSLATTQIYTHISLNEIKKAYSVAHPRSSSKK